MLSYVFKSSCLDIPRLGDLSKDVMGFSARALATPSCALTGLFCAHSLFTTSHSSTTTQEASDTIGTTARPFWKWLAPQPKEEIDVGLVAQGLTKRVKWARNIFDSVKLLGEEHVIDPLDPVRIWQIGAMMTYGTQQDMGVGEQVIKLGDYSRDLMDQLSFIDSTSVDKFSWIQWEFSRLLLSLSSTHPPSPSQLSKTLHHLLYRITSTLDTLHSLTSQSTIHATRASALGREVWLKLQSLQRDHQMELDEAPAWRRGALGEAVSRGKRALVGGPLSRGEIMKRNLMVTQETIKTISSLVRALENTRRTIMGFRDQIGMFDASIMGFHLAAGAEEEEGGLGLGPEEELRILGEVINGFGTAVGQEKLRWEIGDTYRGGTEFLEIAK